MLNAAISEVNSLTDNALASMAGMTSSPETPTQPEAPQTYVVESRYGELTFDATQMVAMQRPILGFPQLTQFGLAKLPSQAGNNLVLLQSLEDANVSFPCFALDPVNPLIEESDVKATCTTLGIKPEDCAILCILTVRQDEASGKNVVTVNLRAPVFIDSARKMAWQMVLTNPRYPIRHAL